jgi:hypothetical protein
MQRIPATIKEVEGKDLVIMEKDCDEHGHFEDIIATDKELYIKSQVYKMDGTPDANPQKKAEQGCPMDCGICSNHKSAAICAMVDVTNRCNLNCPICFANANKKGVVVEWTRDEILRIFRHFRDIKPTPPVVAMMAGGEPTIRDDLPEIISELARMGYRQVQIATNGIRLAKDIDYYRRCLQAAYEPHTDCGIVLYLQFDGTTPETYMMTRGADVFHYKEQLVQNAKSLAGEGIISSGICLVMTVTKDNLFEVPNVIKYAAGNIDVVSGVMFQPVALCGRIVNEDLKENRITTYDVIRYIDDETKGVLKPWRPFVAYHDLMNLIAWYNGDKIVEFTCNPQCGFVTFLNCQTGKDGNVQYQGVERLINMTDGIELVKKVWENAQKVKKGSFFEANLGKMTGSLGDLGKILDDSAFWLQKLFIKYRFIAGALPYLKLNASTISDPTISGALNIMFRPSWWSTRDFLVKGRNLYVGVMHFQDGYDLDTERTSRCVVQYGIIDPGTNQIFAYPFCAYNTCHRERVEREIADARGVPLEESAAELITN